MRSFVLKNKKIIDAYFKFFKIHAEVEVYND